MIFKTAVILTSLAFAFYGSNCLRSQVMISEFKRFGLTTTQRQITGVSQIIGAIGLITGFYYNNIGLIASGGLTILMLLGFIVRIKIKDSFLHALPSFIFIIVNAYLFYGFFQKV